ncbi:hypothetical protein [Listeria fleischmannii]|uniref:hypothetical protein n=1 Tax=Listeria fleischmannii TaxID=1069827 RepID=UPI000254F9C4|nr:hypothetical protein [Listeria fleischmannii]EIA21400.1 hypothetical protein KKC_01382 [Listeria fleischmannii subsp. coloradonensis]STY35276.1 Uncharacterised protein [Listeria fleischmannii subsp. coloradonensis]
MNSNQQTILTLTTNKATRTGNDFRNVILNSENDLRTLAMKANQFSDYLWEQLNELEVLHHD